MDRQGLCGEQQPIGQHSVGMSWKKEAGQPAEQLHVHIMATPFSRGMWTVGQKRGRTYVGAKIFWPLSEPTTFYFNVCCPWHCCCAAPESVPELPSCCGSRQKLLHCSLGEPINLLTEKHKYSKAVLKKIVLKNNTGYSTALLFFMLLCSERKAVLRELAGCI